MKRYLAPLMLASALVGASPSHAQTPVLPYSNGAPVSNSNPFPVAATASVAGFQGGNVFANLTATGSSSASTALPAGVDIVVTNNGTTEVSCTLALGAATGLRNNIQVAPGGGARALHVGASADHIACIDQGGADSTSNPIVIEGGAGLPTGWGGGTTSSGSGGANVGATGSAVPASAGYGGINIGGTLRGHSGVNPSGSIFAEDANLASIAGVTAAVGSGASNTGTLRTILSSDSSVGISGTLPAFAATPTVNLGTLNGAAIATNQTVKQGATGAAVPASAVYGGMNVGGTLTGLVGTANGLKTDGSAVTQPISGSVGLTGTLPAFAATPTFNLGTLNGAATAANQTAVQAATAAAVPASALYTGMNVGGNLTGLTGTANGLKVDGSAVTQPVSQSGAPWSIAGNVASGASDSGNPIKIGGIFLTAQPTVTTGQRVDAQMTARGAQIVATGADTFNITCSNCSGSGVSAIDEATFTAGTTVFAAGGGFFQTTATNNPLTTGQQGAFQVTANRALFTNLRNAAGTEVGTSGAPLRFDPTGTTTQPVSQIGAPWSVNETQIGGNAISTVASGVQKVGIADSGGTALTSALRGSQQALSVQIVDGSGAQVTTFGGSGGTASNFGSAFPTAGTAIGLKNGANMVNGTADGSGNMNVNVQAMPSPVSTTTTLTAWNSSTTLNSTQSIYGTGGYAAVTVLFQQTTTLTAGAATFEGSYDGTNWITIPANQLVTPTSSSLSIASNPFSFVASTNSAFELFTSGFPQVRIRLSTVITGTGAVTPVVTLWSTQTMQQQLDLLTVQALGTPADAVLGTPTGTGSLISAIKYNNATAASILAAIQAPIAAGANTIGNVGLAAQTTGGCAPGHTLTAASNNSTNIKGAPGTLCSLTVTQTTTTLGDLRLYDSASAPTCGSATGVVANYAVQSNAVSPGFTIDFGPYGLAFANGISFCFTGAVADNDNTNFVTGVQVSYATK